MVKIDIDINIIQFKVYEISCLDESVFVVIAATSMQLTRLSICVVFSIYRALFI